jgi:hypothetical protein
MYLEGRTENLVELPTSSIGQGLIPEMELLPEVYLAELLSKEINGTCITSIKNILEEVTAELPEVTAEPPEVTVELPEVTVELPEVTAELPEVTVELSEVTAELPEVTVELPEVTLEEIDNDDDSIAVIFTTAPLEDSNRLSKL